ncbi:MAG TPA: ABC transporter permease, partial [Chitinophagaceae bacterium]|nr:ABC transporter permease [Chitinophagaceae bacterium]
MRMRDTFSLAWRTVRSNRLRTGLTVAIIAFGIMALVGINTAIEAMKQKFTESFSSMGATGFTIRFREIRVFNNGNSEAKKEKKGKKKEKISNVAKPITKFQAETFKNTFDYPSTIGLYMFGARDAIASVQSKKTNPNVRVWGIDENYIDLNGYTIAGGRNLNSLDVQSGRNVA